MDRAVDVALGREVDDRPGSMCREQPPHEPAVADVAAHEAVTRVVPERRQVGEIAGVGELVQVDDRLARRRERGQHEIRADEAGAACD